MMFDTQHPAGKEPSVGRWWSRRTRLDVGSRSRVGTKQEPDLAGLPLFITHLENSDPEVAQFVQLLLEDEGVVQDFHNPGNTDVGHLEILRGDWLVLFRLEHGVAHRPRVGDATVYRATWDECRPLGLAIFAWARAHAVPFRLDDPEDFNHDLVPHGRAALDWLAAGHGVVLERVHSAWLVYRNAPACLQGQEMWASLTQSVTAMNTAAGSPLHERRIDTN
jgi:hypothetical protein